LFKLEQHILKLKIRYFSLSELLIKKDNFLPISYLNNLLEKINKVIENYNRLPIFVSEGDSNKKLETIYNNRYLNFCYDHLKRSKNNLLIFGSSLSNNDKHIIDAINNNKRKKVYYSIYISPEKKFR
jgi:hypothetical protein